VANNETDVSLPKAVKIWFKKFDVSDALLALILQCLDEQKALLLIDGLDEWSNESAARSTLALLTTFVKTKGLPAILTGRPGGLALLGGLDPIWRQGRLAALSDKQQRALTTIWFGPPPSGEWRSDPGGPRAGCLNPGLQFLQRSYPSRHFDNAFRRAPAAVGADLAVCTPGRLAA
jgi:hypothetical protein